MSKRIAVLGLGYVGTATAVTLAQLGHHVVGFDPDINKVETLSCGKVPIFEPGLDDLLLEGLKANRLGFTEDPGDAISGAEFVFICVGTPSLPNGQADLSQVRTAARMIGQYMSGPIIVVNKSTVPVGTGDMVERWIQENRRHPFDVAVVSNPEFLREGTAARDALHPDRIVIGAEPPVAGHPVADLFRSLDVPTLFYNRRTAEMIKYASNAFLATKISFINEIAAICDRVGADVVDVAEGMGYDPRIGPHFLRAGVGYGGSCFPKDTAALIQIAGNVYHDFKLLKAVVDVNQQARMRVVQMLEDALGRLEGKIIAVLGLSFKPHTDDIRESPALTIIPALIERGAKVRATDPVALEGARRWFQSLEPSVTFRIHPPVGDRRLTESEDACTFVGEALTAVEGAHAVVLLTEWPDFLNLDWTKVANGMVGKLVLDGRNVLDGHLVARAGLQYVCMGRPNHTLVLEGVN